jgi:hypothetical protein
LRVLALLTLTSAVVAVGVFLNARLHPASCPGAFIGCASNGEELGYELALGSDILALAAALIAVMETQRRRVPGWRVAAGTLLALSVLLFPLPGGLYAVILLGILSPDFGLYAYLAVPFATGLALALYGFSRRRVLDKPRPPSTPAPPGPAAPSATEENA